jgi:predicted flap endonuclease-1-like 5' DNA nuclease
MSTEPETKKQKMEEPTGWENHTLNVSEALMKNDEGRHFASVIKDEVQTLQGIGPMSSRVLEALGIRTIEELGKVCTYNM